MNFSRSIHPMNKGSLVWKRIATSKTKRRDLSFNSKDIRLNSQTSDYSILADTEPTFNLNPSISQSKKKQDQWSQIKSMAKHSSIASRIELKKTLPISISEKTQKKSPKRDKIITNFAGTTFNQIIDHHGNITKPFKQTTEFKALNPHIIKDVEKMKKRVYSMYQKQRKIMDSFLLQEESYNLKQDLSKVNHASKSKSKSVLMDYDKASEMQKITERQQYESRINSTRLKRDNSQDNKNQIKHPKRVDHDRVKSSFIRKEKKIHLEVTEPYFKRSTTKTSTYSKQRANSCSGTEPNNPLLKGLFGEYANYQKLPKQQLIKKLISLQYLAQSIFKKNKFLQQELQKKQALMTDPQNPINGSRDDKKGIRNESSQKVQKKKQTYFLDNDDGYFNQFLQSQKGRQPVWIQIQQQPERFRQNSEAF